MKTGDTSKGASHEAADRVGDRGPDTSTDRSTDAIDWNRLDKLLDRGTPVESDRLSRDVPEVPEADRPGEGIRSDRTGDAPLIERDGTDHLYPDLESVPLHELYPSRFTKEGRLDEITLQRARSRSDDPKDWVPLVNPHLLDDVAAGRPEHTKNCADCSRSVQETLDGKARVAHGLDPEGLGYDGDEPAYGEQGCYTERWAGRPSDATSYEEIQRQLQSGDKSAIVFGDGPYGGHAFNAIEHDGKVLYADGQTGEVSDWAPAHLREQFPNVKAIFFERTKPAPGDEP